MFRTYDSNGKETTVLKNHLEQSSSISTEAVIIGEWNLNIADNIALVGNYRYRPNDGASPFYNIQTSYDSSDSAGAYTDATYSHTLFNTGIDLATDIPSIFVTNDKKEEMLYSLNECLNRFRPRSGINKLRFFSNKYINTPNRDMFSQPRYYLSSKDDKFKYWSSFRLESVSGTETQRGIANVSGETGFYIDDAAPFVVYTNPVPANRIVVKMQTNSSSFKNEAYKIDNNNTFNDPFYENPNNIASLDVQTTPLEWRIQYLNSSNQWVDAKVFTSGTTRANGKRIVGSDGYVELAYGITNSLAFSYVILGEYNTSNALPLTANTGEAYLVPDITNATSGIVYVWNGTDWTTNSFTPIYDWYVTEEELSDTSSLVTELVSPKVYGTPTNIYTANYRELQYIKGIRVVVKTMSKFGSTFDLIEMSPRLTVDFSDRTISYSIDKIASDIGNSGFPVGDLSVSNGSIEIFDYDQAFNDNNDITLSGNIISGSILSNPNWDISSKNLQIKIYETIKDVYNPTTSLYNNYYVPIKVMYIDGFPNIKSDDRKVRLSLRDLFFYFESITAPPMFLKNVSLTYAVATILDSIGFSNYIFKYAANEEDFFIPYFYIQPDITVAEVLRELAKSSQTSMFFDELNNFVLMSKNYIMGDSRTESMTLYGTNDFSQNGIIENQSPSATPLANIVSLDSEDNLVYNGGKIVYNNKYLQKSYSTIQETSLLPKSQVFKYKPVLLWEVASTSQLRPLNEEVNNQSAYSLAALTLNETLTNQLPYVDSSGNIKNNIIDFGQTIYWATRYNGYFYNNGEIIKYDALQYAITSVPITNLIADIVSGENTFVIKSSNINKLKIGQIINQTSSPGGQLANDITITAINKDTGLITVSQNHTTSGSVTFTATNPETLVWVTSVEEYQKYFNQLPFNGKLYPTGRVRIYAEPYYNNGIIDKTKSYKDVVNGSVISFTGATTTSNNDTNTTDRGAVAKHGRMQFGTGIPNTTLKTNMPVEHKVFDSDSTWLKDNYKKVFRMDSEWIFKNNHQYVSTQYTVTSSSTPATTVYSTTGTVGSITGPTGGFYYFTVTGLGSAGTNFTVGETITATNGTGKFGAGTTTVVKVENGSTIKVKSMTSATIPSNGSVTNITGISNVSGSKIINTSTTTSGLTKDLLWYSGGTYIPSGTKITEVKTFKTGSTTYNQIILSKPLTGTIPGASSIIFVDKQLETLSKSAITFAEDRNKPTTNATIVDIFDASYYNESTFESNQSKVRPVGSIKSSALKISGSLNFYNFSNITQYNNGVYTAANHEFDIDDVVIISDSANSAINGTFTITAKTQNTFTTNNPSTINIVGIARAQKFNDYSSDYLSYVYKPYPSGPTPFYFGTRIRIIGELLKTSNERNEILQRPIGASTIDTPVLQNDTYEIKGTGGGIAINLDINNKSNIGYYFEIDALTLENITDSSGTTTNIPNVYFYKMLKGNSNGNIPVVLWYGSANILCDDGSFAGQDKIVGQANNTVYDLAIEQVQDLSSTTSKTFNLYINNKLVATVTDTDAIPTGISSGVYDYNNAALFVRGSGEVMFENFFTISKNNSKDFNSKEQTSLVFDTQKFDNNVFRKYLVNPFVLSTYLQGIGPNKSAPQYLIDYEEFGSIFRECAYFNVRYDKAFPALYSQISPTFNDRQGYVVSGYTATPYNAEFLIFNATDFALNLDNTTGNYLRIQGVSFTQQSEHDLTVDEYFTKNSDFNNYTSFNKDYINIQNSRSLYGKNDFTIKGEYIQNKDAADGLMSWIVNKIMKPKKSIGIKVFSNPIIQLGDIVKIDYEQNGVRIIPADTKFVVYHTTVNRNGEGPEMTVYLSEVV